MFGSWGNADCSNMRWPQDVTINRKALHFRNILDCLPLPSSRTPGKRHNCNTVKAESKLPRICTPPSYSTVWIDPPNGQPNWLALSHLGGLYSSVLLPLKERKLACSGAERARCSPAFCRCHVPTNRALWRHDNQPSLVLLSCSDQSVGSRLISWLDFTFNPFLHI